MEVSITDSQSLDRLSLHSQEDLDDINIEKYLQSAGRAAGWAKDFDCLLSDSIGLGKFTEFLQKEFSHENIFFWSACEKFKLLGAGADRLQLAQEILRRHLELGAAEPVNVDSAARAATRHRVALATAAAPPEASVFMSAQRQIYNLMKFDSYPRCGPGPRPGVPRAVTHRLATPRGIFTTSPAAAAAPDLTACFCAGSSSPRCTRSVSGPRCPPWPPPSSASCRDPGTPPTLPTLQQHTGQLWK